MSKVSGSERAESGESVGVRIALYSFLAHKDDRVDLFLSLSVEFMTRIVAEY